MQKKQKKSAKKPLKEIFISLGIVALVLAIPIAIVVSQQDTNTSSHASTPQPIGQTGNWNMIFSDEFNSTALDSSKWTPGWFGTGVTGPVNSAETACYDSAQVGVPGDGNLHLHLIAQPSTCKGATRPNTGSMVSSNGKYQYTYGYVEFRAFLPAASAGVIGNWPALWSDGQNWPADGENDTMEGLGTDGKACYHFHSPVGGPGGCAPGDYTGWHTFGSDWEPGVVTYYYDGVQVGQITNGITSSPQYLIMNNTQSADGAPTVAPADMLVDYVRVWQKCTTNCPTDAPVPTSTPMPIPTNTPAPLPTNTIAPLPTNTPMPTSVPVTNMLKNPSFESGTSAWGFTVRKPVSATFTTTNSTKADGSYSAQININKSSSTSWNLQFSQSNLPLVAGRTYTVSFWAKASKNMQIEHVVQQQGGNWTEYSKKVFSINATWQKYSYTFTQPITTATFFTFNLAKSTGTIWIDGVSLQ